MTKRARKIEDEKFLRYRALKERERGQKMAEQKGIPEEEAHKLIRRRDASPNPKSSTTIRKKKLSREERVRVAELVEVCKEFQGEYIPGDHGPGSWATTYSNQFVDAASELYLILEGVQPEQALARLAQYLSQAGVRSCRGSPMSMDRAQYLYDQHIKYRVKFLGVKSPNK